MYIYFKSIVKKLTYKTDFIECKIIYKKIIYVKSFTNFNNLNF